MKDNFVVTIAGGGSTYTPGIVMMLLENMSRFPLREIRLYDNHHQRQKTIGDACAIAFNNQERMLLILSHIHN